MSDYRVTIDVPQKIDPSKAAELMAHHLMLAAAYFEATPDLQTVALAELNVAFEHNTMGLTAARTWFAWMNKAYEDDRG